MKTFNEYLMEQEVRQWAVYSRNDVTGKISVDSKPVENKQMARAMKNHLIQRDIRGVQADRYFVAPYPLPADYDVSSLTPRFPSEGNPQHRNRQWDAPYPPEFK